MTDWWQENDEGVDRLTGLTADSSDVASSTPTTRLTAVGVVDGMLMNLGATPIVVCHQSATSHQPTVARHPHLLTATNRHNQRGIA